MTFWGTEVKPGKPFTHKANDSNGRLHISMATLGFSPAPAKTKSVLQSNVGNKSPVYLCSLYPRISESLQLHLEFDEVDDVILSVIGPRSIHLSGYYLGSGRRSSLISDSESYGEDIAESETQRSDNSEDKYEDSFIDDGDLEVFSPSSVSNTEDDFLNDKKPKSGKCRRFRKKCIVSESDDEPPSQQKHAKCSSHVPVVENENDDNLSMSALCKSKTTSKKVACDENKLHMEMGNKKTKDVGNSEAESQRNDDDVVNGQAERQSCLPVESLLHPELSSGNDGTPNKKRKQSRDQEIRPGDTEADRIAQNLNLEDEQQQQKAAHDLSVGTENEKRPKKRKKQKEVKAFEGDSAHHETVGNENKTETFANENKTEQDDGGKDERMGQDLPMSSDQNHKANHHVGQESCAFTEENQIVGKKVKKKKKKNNTQVNEEAANADIPTVSADRNLYFPMEIKSENANAVTSQVRTLETGLVIEQIEAGKPDGKIASPGKKLSVSYVGKLKNGEVIESTMGSSPYKFRLGAGSVIEGWEVGIDGMQVGEKRRIVIPPTMGYGSEGDGKNIPPNSWLIYDIELIKVRR